MCTYSVLWNVIISTTLYYQYCTGQTMLPCYWVNKTCLYSYYSQVPLYFLEANDACRNTTDGLLVMKDNAKVDYFLRNGSDKERIYWIGIFHRRYTSGKFIWIDDSALSKEEIKNGLWEDPEHRGAKQSDSICIAMYYDTKVKWRDYVGCNHTLSYALCQRNYSSQCHYYNYTTRCSWYNHTCKQWVYERYRESDDSTAKPCDTSFNKAYFILCADTGFHNCDGLCDLGEWTNWSECPTTCGKNATKYRTRKGLNKGANACKWDGHKMDESELCCSSFSAASTYKPVAYGTENAFTIVMALVSVYWTRLMSTFGSSFLIMSYDNSSQLSSNNQQDEASEKAKKKKKTASNKSAVDK